MSRTYSSFETTPRPAERRYINLLDAPKFSTIPHMCVVDGVTNSTCFRFPWFADIRYCWRIPLPHEYPSVRTKVLESERIRRAVENAARETATLEPELHNLAYQFFLRMRAHLSKVLCKIASYMLFKTFRRLSSRVLVCPSQMERLVEAEKTAVPVIYLPLHRSHLDYLLITWTVWHWKIRLPHIASGDNLNLSGLGWLLRSFGAFFIRRQFHGGTEDSPSEELYRAVLNTYVLQLLKSGMSIEFFLEGTRSRFGKSPLPKNGLISNIVSAVREGEIFDVQLVPVSITYEQPVEGVLVEELKGCGKKRESIWTIISGLMTCFGTISRCGDIIVDYGTPVLLSTHLKLLSENIEKYKGLLNLGHETNPNSYRELVPWHGDDSSDRMLIRAIGYDIVFQAQQRKPINCSSMIALLMVSLYRDDPVPLSKFLVSLNMLAQEIHNLGFMVVGWTGEGVVDVRKQFTKGLVYLNDTVVLIPAQNSTEDYADEPFLKLRSQTQDCLLLLAYHKNGAIAPYVLISMAALSILSFCNVKTGFEECVQRTFHLCNLMQYEIIFCSPCDDLRYEITKALEFLNYDEENTTENNMAAMSPPSEGSSQNARFSLNMYANILRPFLQSCLIVILDLLKRPKTDKVEKDSDYIREFIRNFFKTKSELDVMPEAVNQDTMYNAIKLLRLKGIIEKNGLEILDELKARIYEDAFKTFLIYRTVEKQANA